MQIRILCGGHLPTSPFIEGGCTFEWVESLEEPRELSCPNCGQTCQEAIVEWTILKLLSHRVFAVGCHHRAFTFSRRPAEPYFYPMGLEEEAEEQGESRDPPTAS